MPTVVVDASAIGAMLFDEPKGPMVAERTRGFNLTAPALIRHELVSIAIKKCRLHPEDRQRWQRNLRNYPDWGVHERPIVAAAVFALALDTGLTAYDASYLWLARHLGAELVTLDGELAAVALASR